MTSRDGVEAFAATAGFRHAQLTIIDVPEGPAPHLHSQAASEVEVGLLGCQPREPGTGIHPCHPPGTRHVRAGCYAFHLWRRDSPTTPISRTHGLHPGFTTSCCLGTGTTATCGAVQDRLKGAGRGCELGYDLLGIQALIIQSKDRKVTGHDAGKCHRCGRR